MKLKKVDDEELRTPEAEIKNCFPQQVSTGVVSLRLASSPLCGPETHICLEGIVLVPDPWSPPK
jgi:hypothetical protein